MISARARRWRRYTCCGAGHMVGVAQLVEHRVVVPGVGGSSPLTHPKIDRLLTCTGALYKIYSRHRDVAPASGRGWDEFVFASLGGKAW